MPDAGKMIDKINAFSIQCDMLSPFAITLICNNAATDPKIVDFPDGFELSSNVAFNVVFVNGHESTTGMSLNGKTVKVNDAGTYIDVPNVGGLCLQAGMALSLYYDSTNDCFVIAGNPILVNNGTNIMFANGTVLWDYIKSKISSDLGLTATAYGGTAASATTALRVRTSQPSPLVNGDIWLA